MKSVFVSSFIFILLISGARAEDVIFEGIRALKEHELREVVSKLPERRWNQEDFSQLEREVKDALALKGYDQPKIRLERRGSSIALVVQEGLPSRLLSVRFATRQTLGRGRESEWRKLNRILESEIEFDRLGQLDRSRIQDWKRIIEGVLVSESYVGNFDIQVEEEAWPSVTQPAESLPEDLQALLPTTWRFVNMTFKMNLGRRASFGFRGNRRLSRAELLEVVEEQKVVGWNQRLAAGVTQAIEAKYRSIGYFHANVQFRTVEKEFGQGQHITFLIEEGERVEIERIEFEGNVRFSSSELENRFYQMAPSFPSRDIYVEKEVETGAESLMDYIRSKGFLAAKLVSVNRVFSNNGQRVRIKIYIYEGDQTRLRQVRIDGISIFSKDEVMKWLGLKEEEPLNLFSLTAGIDVIKREYRNRGYLGVRIRNENQSSVVRYTQKNQFADVWLDLVEGPQFRVGDIFFEGLIRTDRDIVERELMFAKGDVLEERRLIETEANLRRLGIFSKITLEHRDDPNDSTLKQVRIAFEEVGRIRVAFGVGFRNDFGIRGFAEAAYTNLWERNHTWSILTNANRRLDDFRFFEYELAMRYLWPYFYLPKLDFRPEVSFERRQYILFDAETVSARTTFEWPIVERWNLVGSFTYALERTQQFNSQFEADNRTLRIGSVTPGFRLDLRDNPLLPKSGIFTSATLEVALPEFGSQKDPAPVGYTRFQYRLDGFIPVTRGLIWFLSFRTGFQRNLINPSDYPASLSSQIGIPLSKQFALGGPASLRGFQLQEINVQNLTIQGTLSYVNIRTQIDFPFTETLKLGPFMDAGGLHVDRYLLGGMRYAVGFGIHYSTPVGPVNFDWGFKLDPGPGEDTERFHFTIGVL